MRGVEGDIEEQRLVWIMLFNDVDRFPGNQPGGIPLVIAAAIVAVPIVAAVPNVREVVECAVVVPILKSESTPGWQKGWIIVAKMPFANDGGLVTDLLECLGKRPFIGGQTVSSPRPNDAALQSQADRVSAGQESAARW